MPRLSFPLRQNLRRMFCRPADNTTNGFQILAAGRQGDDAALQRFSGFLSVESLDQTTEVLR